MNAKFGNFFFNKNVFLSCVFANENGLFESFHHLWNTGQLYSYKTFETSDDLAHSFAIFTTSETKTLTHKETGRLITNVFWNKGKQKIKVLDMELQDDPGYINYYGDNSEILELDFGYSQYIRLKPIRVNRYNLEITNMAWGCNTIEQKTYEEELKNFYILKEEVRKNEQDQFAL